MEAIVHEMDGFRPGREPSAVRRLDMVPSDRGVTKVYRRLTGLANAEHGSATELAVSGLAGFTPAWAAIADDGAGQVACRSTWFAPSAFTLSDPGYLVA